MNKLILFFAVLDILLLAWTFRLENNSSARLWFLRAMLLGMGYDNLIIGVGNWSIGQSWYELANIPRFLLHSLILPFLTIFTLSIMRAAEVGMANNTTFCTCCWLFTLAALVYGVYHEFYLLELGPEVVMGINKMASLSKLPPIATILTNIVIIPMAFFVWRKTGWKWFFFGVTFIFVVNGATGPLSWGFIAGNFSELVLMLCLIGTERYFQQPPVH